MMYFQDEDGSISYHGVAFVNLAPLLYPGGMFSSKIKFRFKLNEKNNDGVHFSLLFKSGSEI